MYMYIYIYTSTYIYNMWSKVSKNKTQHLLMITLSIIFLSHLVRVSSVLESKSFLVFSEVAVTVL